MWPDAEPTVGRYEVMWCPTVVTAGEGYAASALESRIPRSGVTLVIADPRFEDFARSLLVGRDVAFETAARADVETLRRVTDAVRRGRPAAVVALGGGSVIDTAKLAVSVAGHPTALDRLLRSAAGRGALPTRRGIRTGGPRLFALPTTIGTASEVSPVACLTMAGGHRLMIGDDLRPDVAVLDGTFLAGLGTDAICEGAMEALLRLVGAVIAADTDDRFIARSARTAARLTALVDPARAGSRDARAELAVISSRTRSSWSSSTLHPWGVTHWYLANELAFVAGIRKIPATLPIVDAVWARMLAGDARLGNAESLRCFWRCWARITGSTSSEPVQILRHLARAWSLPTVQWDDGVVERTVRGLLSAWCAPGQALGGWPAEDLRAILRDSLRRSDEWVDRADAASARERREEVTT